ncbi:MAG: polymer-forming cytoskeletal protein, partial [Gemmatimonadota bacterium]|nr:polymer-forming cytoskeletal protein [Gemmatimonadota bacterium]
MRTEITMLPALVLAIALHAIAPPLAVARQDPITVDANLDVARRGTDSAHLRISQQIAGDELLAAAGASPAAEREVDVRSGDQVVAPGEVIEGDLVVAGGDLRVEGEIRGNAVVTGGDLILVEGAYVLGDAVVTGGKIISEGGRIRGEMRTINNGPGMARTGSVSASSEGTTDDAGERGRSESRSWFSSITRGLSDIVSTLALGLVLGLVGAVLVFYGLGHLRTVSATLRHSTGRSAAVGLAATFLVIPAFVLLVVALAVTIVGIPLLLVAVPVYPLLVVAAFGFGLVAAAHAIGERTLEERDGVTPRYHNAYTYI